MARKRLPQTHFVRQIADFEGTPLHRFWIAAREIVVANRMQTGTSPPVTKIGIIGSTSIELRRGNHLAVSL
jgi:hypothetical protein